MESEGVGEGSCTSLAVICKALHLSTQRQDFEQVQRLTRGNAIERSTRFAKLHMVQSLFPLHRRLLCQTYPVGQGPLEANVAFSDKVQHQIVGQIGQAPTMVQLLSVLCSSTKPLLRANPCCVGKGPSIPNWGKQTGVPPLSHL
eukprot:695604-Pelagomonas_calceolata.AAC.4